MPLLAVCIPTRQYSTRAAQPGRTHTAERHPSCRWRHVHVLQLVPDVQDEEQLQERLELVRLQSWPPPTHDSATTCVRIGAGKLNPSWLNAAEQSAESN